MDFLSPAYQNPPSEIDIEIQLSILNVWADRALFYLAKMYTDQIRPGQDYTVFKKCVSISILDFVLFREDPEFYSCFHIREDSRQTLYTDKMEFLDINFSMIVHQDPHIHDPLLFILVQLPQAGI